MEHNPKSVNIFIQTFVFDFVKKIFNRKLTDIEYDDLHHALEYVQWSKFNGLKIDAVGIIKTHFPKEFKDLLNSEINQHREERKQYVMKHIHKAVQSLNFLKIPAYKIVLWDRWQDYIDDDHVFGLPVVFDNYIPEMVLSNASMGRWVPIFSEHAYAGDSVQAKRQQESILRAYRQWLESPPKIRECPNYPHGMNVVKVNETGESAACPLDCGWEETFVK